MARKKQEEEHENLERWMVSYADFLTLLFATFVVLYALSQINLEQFRNLEVSMKKAFSAPSLIQGEKNIMEGGDNILDNNPANSMIDSLMLELVSPAYEQESFEQIKKEIEAMSKTGELNGVSVSIDERGLVIKMNDKDILFKSGSADLSPEAKKMLDVIGKLIVQKFAMHMIKVEGHTDPVPSSGKYPSNWELSSARASSIVRYLQSTFKILPDLFSAVGYADTRPVDKSKTKEAYAKNRRVEIVVLRNQIKNLEHFQNSFLSLPKEQQQKLRNEQVDIVNNMDNLEIKKIEERLKNKQTPAEQAPSAQTEHNYWRETNKIDSLK